jgi:predicted glutamine amidotransferase
MCGIIGFFVNEYKDNHKCRDWFTQMLITDSLRGIDGTGVVFMPHKGNISIYKKPVPGWDLAFMPAYKSLIGKEQRLVLGHNRSATRGTVSPENTHPFETDNIVLVHNGTLTLTQELPRADVDSEAITLSLEKKEDPVETLSILKGAYALVWFDFRTEELCMARNDERPLSLTYDKENKKLFWASEEWMMLGVAQRVGIELQEPRLLPAFELLKYKFDGENFAEPTVVKYEEKKKEVIKFPPPYQTSKHRGKTFESDNDILKELGLQKGDTVYFTITKVAVSIIGKDGEKKCTLDGLSEYAEEVFEVVAYQQDYEKLLEDGLEDANAVFKGKVSFCYRRSARGLDLSTQVVGLTEVRGTSAKENDEKLESYKKGIELANSADKYTYLKGPDGWVPKKEFLELIKDGCSKCNEKISSVDHDSILWEKDRPLCKRCSIEAIY